MKNKCYSFVKGVLYVKYRYVDPPALSHEFLTSFAGRKGCSVEFLGEQSELEGLPSISRVCCVAVRGAITEDFIALFIKNFIGETNLIFAHYEKV